MTSKSYQRSEWRHRDAASHADSLFLFLRSLWTLVSKHDVTDINNVVIILKQIESLLLATNPDLIKESEVVCQSGPIGLTLSFMQLVKKKGH